MNVCGGVMTPFYQDDITFNSTDAAPALCELDNSGYLLRTYFTNGLI